MTANDLELLRRFACDRAQDAFTELVNRHLNLVYSAALRQVRSPQLAEEVAQSVFADLARDAGKLKPDTILTAWLYQVARRKAIDVVRKESRRQLREQLVHEMNITNAPDASWPQVEPLLDEAVAALDETDRAAVLLRYFEKQSLREVGQQLGVSDDAAQKRVSRAVERLRDFFTKRGVSVGAGGLVVVISANAVQAAPVGLAVTISAAALAGTAATTSTIIAATAKTIAMTTLQKTLVTATVAVLAGAGIYQAKQAHDARAQIQMLQQQQAPLVEQVQQLQNNFADATNRLADLIAENSRLKSNPNQTELLKLRGQVGVLSSELADAKSGEKKQQPALATAKDYLNRSFKHGASREYEAELDDLNHAIELDPTLAQAYRERAVVYSRIPENRGGEKQVIADYSRSLELQPNDVGSLFMRADAYEKIGEYDKSIADYSAVIENQNAADYSNVSGGNKTDKNYWMASAYTMRAQIYKNDKHNYANAIADYTATIQLNPISPSAYRSRGECYEEIGETAKAQQDFAIEPKR